MNAEYDKNLKPILKYMKQPHWMELGKTTLTSHVGNKQFVKQTVKNELYVCKDCLWLKM